mmetsp:Transcript_119356/g.382557  ORF Transcript_119356/g.382557 Transcript_119356/m.382557 type:complete len:122 (-) Transcript_119356:487-852(-)
MLNRSKWVDLDEALQPLPSWSLQDRVRRVARLLQCKEYRRIDRRLLKGAMLKLDAEAAELSASEEDDEQGMDRISIPPADPVAGDAGEQAPRMRRPDPDDDATQAAEADDVDGGVVHEEIA